MALIATIGVEKREAFLQRMAPDYPAAAFINRSLDRTEGRAMVFLRYAYYLRVPFEMGDPGVSWLMNPDKLAQPSLILRFLRQENIRLPRLPAERLDKGGNFGSTARSHAGSSECVWPLQDTLMKLFVSHDCRSKTASANR